MPYSVYVTETFDRETKNLSFSDKESLQKIFVQLKENPYVGKPLKLPFFREKRMREKRVYYLVYDDLQAVLAVAFGGKKEQQKTIDRVVSTLKEFKEYLKNILKKN